MCAYDKDRVCDDTCTARSENEYTMLHEPYWDGSDAVPQYKWKATRFLRGPVCQRNTLFPIIKLCKEVNTKENEPNEKAI